MDFNTPNGTIVLQWGYFTRGTGSISDIKTYTGTFPISFPRKCWTGTCTTGTANGVVGAAFEQSDGSTLQWSMKPNHSATSNSYFFFITIGY